MKQLLTEVSKQPKDIQNLIRKMIEAQMQDKETLSILYPKITAAQLRWLWENGFDTKFNYITKEYEVML